MYIRCKILSRIQRTDCMHNVNEFEKKISRSTPRSEELQQAQGDLSSFNISAHSTL